MIRPVLAAIALLLVAPAPARGARTIAIAYFDNNTGKPELDPLRKGLADMLITDLANVGSLQIVERERLNQVLGELKLSRGSRYPKDQNVQSQCKLLLEIIARNAKLDPAARKKSFDEKWQKVTLDWELALKATMPDIFELFRLYGRKGRAP